MIQVYIEYKLDIIDENVDINAKFYQTGNILIFARFIIPTRP